MAINAKDRFAKLPKARQEKILARAEEMIAEEMSLTQLREVCMRSQAQLAEKLGIKQAAVSRLERRTDMYLSTLRNLIASMGGTLRIVAQFPDRPLVCINQFHDLDVMAVAVVDRTTALVETKRHQSSASSSESKAHDDRCSYIKIPPRDGTIEVKHDQSSSTHVGPQGRRRTRCVKFPKPRTERRRRPTN
jgi:transcriptional regulator with XRE-family HTH domain